MNFSELRLAGFKSFVEPTTLKIDAGMTGIVGPNGCGKSNLIEALRWVMGETSAKKMRGSEMDDVIFGGTEQRPARNIAEVALVMDNTTRDATAEFNNSDEIEVTRKIERGEGSDYRINGKAVRQKDVQLVFADQATGAHSTSIVSQGQVGAIVNAKPQERRQILEEAAGITGLHARRHEAELRLKAAETNLTRAEDILRNLESQYNSLQRQAKQATKYRTVAETIRKTEAALLHLKYTEAQNQQTDADTNLTQTDRTVRDLTVIVTRGNTERAEMAATLPPLRADEAAAAAALQRLIITRETLDTELERAAQQLEEQKRLLEQTIADASREQALCADAEAALARLEDEQQSISEIREQFAEKLPAYEAEAADAQRAVNTLEAQVSDAMNTLAQAQAERATLDNFIQQVTTRMAYITQRREQAEQQLQELLAADTNADARRAAAEKMAAAEKQIVERQAAAEAAEAAWHEAESNAASAAKAKMNDQSALNKAEAEAAALIEILSGGEALFAPVIDQISTEAGCEAALGAALGEALSAGLASDAPIYWQDFGRTDTPSLPQGAEPISTYIKAPAALQRVIAFIGMVDDAATGQRLAAQLKPGQTLVSRAGDCWRWDGFTIKADAPTAAAIKLKQKNRLAEVKNEIATLQQALNGAATLVTLAEQGVERAQEASKVARTALQDAYQALDEARAENAALIKAEAATLSAQEAAKATLDTLADEYTKLDTDLQNANQRKQTLQDLSGMEDTLNKQRATLGEARLTLIDAQQKLLNQKSELATCDRRALAAGADIQLWQDRMQMATARQQDLASRRALAETTIERLQSRPADIDGERRALLSQLSEAEAKRQAATDKLVAAENTLAERERQLKQDEEKLVEARENRVRAEGSLSAAQHLLTELSERMMEKLEATPADLLFIADYTDTDALLADIKTQGDESPIAVLEKKVAKLAAERESIGPVNLRADVEAQELTGELERIGTERNDLTQAIAKLRHGITELNTEARERLNKAFNDVNEHFQDLFVRLFGGGRAYLQLQEAEDALEAGLEIYASPPGKKLQVLSLLSGGEKALTATALLFAVFLCNPSPICVLDEVDAPLDESNVGRFCDLVEEIAKAKKTRFLIVTHHRLTMARMDRLYGVTMQERGVSTLMSVDLATAERFRELPSKTSESKAA
ncbi:MAG: chromosome segregation protein SMC [Bdellovibrionales bacterium]